MRLVVVGGVAAGLSAASRARKLDRSMEIVVLEKGQRISYGACGLPYLIEGQVRHIDQLTVYTPDFFERERDIRIRTNAEVTAVEHARREVALANGERVRYDRLVWAAGARPAHRSKDPRVFHLHTDVDATRLNEFLRASGHGAKSAAIVGGGYIGLEMAGALRAHGLKVTLYDSGSHLLHWHADWLTKLIGGRLEKSRIGLRLGSTVAQPESLPDDLVLSAVGLKPNVEPLVQAGAELGRSGALRTDERMETSLGGVYAAGDCCESRHIVTGAGVWVPLGTTANKMGRVAGANAAGRRERFPGICGTSVVRVAGLGIGTSGLSEQMARKEGFNAVAARIEARERPRYFFGKTISVELVADRATGRLLGGAVAGDADPTGRTNVIAAALTARMKAEEFADLDLAYTPPYSSVRDPLLIAAQELLKLLS